MSYHEEARKEILAPKMDRRADLQANQELQAQLSKYESITHIERLISSSTYMSAHIHTHTRIYALALKK